MRLEVDGNVLVVSVEERPAISQIEFTGQKEFDKDKLRDALKQIGLAQGRIFDRSLLEKAEQELKNQYLSRGKYAVEITTTVTPLERNRVNINFTIAEGPVAKIRQINPVGNKVFKEGDLLDLFVLRTPGLLTWYSKNDQYSKQKLEADLEIVALVLSQPGLPRVHHRLHPGVDLAGQEGHLHHGEYHRRREVSP